MLKYLFLLFFIIGVVSCKTGSDRQKETEAGIPGKYDDYEGINVPRYVLEGIISDLSSILEEAVFVKELGVPFSESYLASAAKPPEVSKEEHLLAFNLGVLGSNLGYLSMYERYAEIPYYLEAISEVSGQLDLDDSIDLRGFHRIAEREGGGDSLLYMSVQSFNRINNYFFNNNKEHLSAVMVAGLWLEGLYLLTRVAKSHQSEDLTVRIGEHKVALNDLLIALKYYQVENEALKQMADALEKIKRDFQEVEIRYEMGESETVEKDGMLMVIQNEISIVDMPGETLARISQNAEKIRKELIH